MGCVYSNKFSFELKCGNLCTGDNTKILSHANLNLEKKKGMNRSESDRRVVSHITEGNTKISLIDNKIETEENKQNFNTIKKNV